MKSKKSKKAALVLSGGAALGLAHIGVIKVLLDAGYEFDAIYGVSAGAIVGAALAGGMSIDEIESLVEKSDFTKLFNDYSPSSSGLVKGRRVRDFFNQMFEGRNIEDLDIDFSAGATDFVSGRYVQISRGNVADALRASSGIPLIFQPFDHPDFENPLVDGMLTQNLPLRDAVEQYKGDTIIAINVNAINELPDGYGQKRIFGMKKDIKTTINHAYLIMINAQFVDVSDTRVQLIEPKLGKYSRATFSSNKLKHIINAGQVAAREFLKSN